MANSNRYDNDIDKAIDRYTHDPMYISDIEEVWKDALFQYNLDSNTKVYRGLNFDTKEDYDKFINSLEKGYLKTQSITSWSPNKDTAVGFASTKPTYMEFMTKERAKQISEASKKGEYITGYRGVVLETIAKKDISLDLEKSKFHKEPEILIPASNIKIIKITDIKTFEEEYKDKNIFDDFRKITKEHLNNNDNKNRRYQKLYNYVFINHKPEDFSYEDKAHLFKLLYGNKKVQTRVELKKASIFDDNPDEEIIEAAMTIFPIDKIDYFNQDDINKILPEYTKKMKLVIDNVFKLWNPNRQIKWLFEYIKYAKFTGLSDYLNKKMRATIGKEYNAIDARELNKKYGGNKAAEIALANINKILNSINTH
jgi:hypothetical protein